MLDTCSFRRPHKLIRQHLWGRVFLKLFIETQNLDQESNVDIMLLDEYFITGCILLGWGFETAGGTRGFKIITGILI